MVTIIIKNIILSASNNRPAITTVVVSFSDSFKLEDLVTIVIIVGCVLSLQSHDTADYSRAH